MLQTIWVTLRSIYIVLFGLMVNVCFAQEIPLELASLDTTKWGSRLELSPEPVPKTDTHISPPKPKYAFNLDIKLDTHYYDRDYWDAYVKQPTYHINYEYAGLEGVIKNQLEKLANRYYRKQLRDYWEQSYLHPLDLDKRVRELNLQNGEHRWWDRTWRESLPPEKGGQQEYTQQIGSKIEIIQIGPTGITNEGRFSWETWRFDVEDNQDVNLTDVEAIREGAIKENYNLGVRSPEAEYQSDWFQFRAAVRVNLRVDNLTQENKSELGVTFKVNLVSKGSTYAKITCTARMQPLTRRAEIQVQVSLLEF